MMEAPTVKPTVKKPVRYLGTLLAALVLALSAVLLAPAPAQAGGPTMRLCFLVWDEEDEIFERICVDFEVPVAGPRKWWPKDCWVCNPFLRFEDYAVNPAERLGFYEQLGQGQVLLAQASLTKDEKLAEELRAEAAEVFYSAAKLIDAGGQVSFKEFGWVDPQSGKLYGSPQPEPPTIAGKSFEAGLRYMQQAAASPDPDPWIQSAMKEFEYANAMLAEFAAT
jgi:hypothetical protein